MAISTKFFKIPCIKFLNIFTKRKHFNRHLWKKIQKISKLINWFLPQNITKYFENVIIYLQKMLI